MPRSVVPDGPTNCKVPLASCRFPDTFVDAPSVLAAPPLPIDEMLRMLPPVMIVAPVYVLAELGNDTVPVPLYVSEFAPLMTPGSEKVKFTAETVTVSGLFMVMVPFKI